MKPRESSPAAVFRKVAQNLYRLESTGTYYALFKRAGKQIRKCLKTTDGELARRRLRDLSAKVSRLSQTRGAGKLTFQDLSGRWLDNHRAHLKEKSLKRLETCIKGLKPHFGRIPLRNVTAQHCESWVQKRGKTISASSYKQERRVLLAVLDYAVRDGLILDNPARDSVPTRKVPKAKIIIPSKDQFKLLVDTVRKADVRAKSAGDLVELLAYSGMRLGEAVNLTWGDIDWDRGTFKITGGEGGTKNLEQRVVPLFPALRNLLEAIRGDTEHPADERVIPIDNAKRAIITACAKAGLPHFLHHSLRHYFCSNAIEAGIDFKVIAGWLGHKDGGFLVAKTYGHLRDLHSFEMARRMTFSARETTPAPANVLPLDVSRN